MSPGRAPERSSARPDRTSPTTVTFIRISSRRVVSPPANGHLNFRAARRSPAKNSSSQPASVRLGQSETQKEASRLATHRRNVADRARQTFPSDRIGRMFVAQKMSSLQKPVASQNGLVATTAEKTEPRRRRFPGELLEFRRAVAVPTARIRRISSFSEVFRVFMNAFWVISCSDDRRPSTSSLT